MATQRINFATINTTSMESLSKFNKAHFALKDLREKYKANTTTVETEISMIKDERKKAMENGMSTDEAISKFSIESKLEQLATLKVEYENACRPHKDAQKEAMKWVDSNLYYGYILAQKGSLNAKGEISIKKGKSTETITLEKSYTDMIKDFLVAIGCSKTENENALNKFATTMSIRTSGMIKCNNGDDYVKVKSTSQYNSLFILNFLQFLVIERGLLVESEDHTLSMKVFE